MLRRMKQQLEKASSMGDTIFVKEKILEAFRTVGLISPQVHDGASDLGIGPPDQEKEDEMQASDGICDWIVSKVVC